MNTMLLKIKTFIKSFLFHIINGLPKSTQEEINKRYSICLECENFMDDECLECGCNVNNKRVFLNKLAWADQHCPINKWSVIIKE